MDLGCEIVDLESGWEKEKRRQKGETKLEEEGESISQPSFSILAGSLPNASTSSSIPPSSPPPPSLLFSFPPLYRRGSPLHLSTQNAQEQEAGEAHEQEQARRL